MKRRTRSVYLFARSATRNQKSAPNNVINQMKALRSYAKRNKWNVRGSIVFTGTVREGLDRISKLFNKGETIELLCTDLTRLSRDPESMSVIVNWVAARKLVILTLDDLYDGHPLNLIPLFITSSLYLREFQDHSDRIKRGIARKRKK